MAYHYLSFSLDKWFCSEEPTEKVRKNLDKWFAVLRKKVEKLAKKEGFEFRAIHTSESNETGEMWGLKKKAQAI